MDKTIGGGMSGSIGTFIPVETGNRLGEELKKQLGSKETGKVDYSRKGGHITQVTVKPDNSENTFIVTPRPGNQAFKVTAVSPEGVRREATREEIRQVRQVFNGSLPNVVDPETDAITDGLERAENAAMPAIWIDGPIRPFPGPCFPPIIPLIDGPQFPNKPRYPSIKPQLPPCDIGGSGGPLDNMVPKVWMDTENLHAMETHAQGVEGKAMPTKGLSDCVKGRPVNAVQVKEHGMLRSQASGMVQGVKAQVLQATPVRVLNATPVDLLKAQ